MELKELKEKDYLEGIEWDSLVDNPEKVSEAIDTVKTACTELSSILKDVDEDTSVNEQLEPVISELNESVGEKDLAPSKAKLEEIGKSLNTETHATLRAIIDQLQKIITRAETLPSKPVREEGDDIEEKQLTSKARKGLDSSAFVFPKERKYPIHDEAHARAALQRVSQFGTPEEKAKVKAAVKRRYPNIKISEEEESIESPGIINESIDTEKIELIGHLVDSKLTESGRIFAGGRGTEWEAVCIAPGISRNRTIYSDEVLERASALFEGVQCFADHSDNPSRSVKDLVGWFDGPKFVPGVGITAKFHALESRPWFTEAMTEAFERGRNDLIGFSINGEGTKRLGKYDGKLAYFVESIKKIDSVDGVVSPSAGGRAVRLLASQDNKEQEDLELLEDLNLEELKAARPDLIEQLIESTKDGSADSDSDKEKIMELKEQEEKDKETEEALSKIRENTKATQELLASLKNDAELARADAKLTAELSKADLPEVVKDKLREDFTGKIFGDEELSKVIGREKDVLAKLADQRPESYGRVTVGEGEVDKKRKAIQGMISGEDVDGVPRAKSIREAYAMWNDDKRSAWQIEPGEILKECASPSWHERDDGRLREIILSSGTSGAAGLFGTILNEYMYRRMLDVYAMPYLEDWRKVVSQITPLPDFRAQRRSWQGGYGKFALVPEALGYALATSPTSDEAHYSASKYGGTETLTLETIANDDLGAVQRIPVSLARGMKHTLYEHIFDKVCGNPNLVWGTDTTALYTSGIVHANVIVSATGEAADASLNDATLTAAKLAMFNQTEVGSSKKIGITPKYLIVPPALVPTARRLLENEFSYWGGNSGSYAAPSTSAATLAAFPPYAAANDINVHRNSLEIIAVPYLANTDSWVLLADPTMHPTVEVGFYQGRQEPEMFVQDMGNVGSMFTYDYITYKIRHIFGSLILDYRSFVKSSTGTTP